MNLKSAPSTLPTNWGSIWSKFVSVWNRKLTLHIQTDYLPNFIQTICGCALIESLLLLTRAAHELQASQCPYCRCYWCNTYSLECYLENVSIITTKIFIHPIEIESANIHYAILSNTFLSKDCFHCKKKLYSLEETTTLCTKFFQYSE